jgi:hypothetical protein
MTYSLELFAKDNVGVLTAVGVVSALLALFVPQLQVVGGEATDNVITYLSFSLLAMLIILSYDVLAKAHKVEDGSVTFTAFVLSYAFFALSLTGYTVTRFTGLVTGILGIVGVACCFVLSAWIFTQPKAKTIIKKTLAILSIDRRHWRGVTSLLVFLTSCAFLFLLMWLYS